MLTVDCDNGCRQRTRGYFHLLNKRCVVERRKFRCSVFGDLSFPQNIFRKKFVLSNLCSLGFITQLYNLNGRLSKMYYLPSVPQI